MPRAAEPAPGPAGRALIAALRRALSAAADPQRAARMQAYMKSTMPYWGVPASRQRSIWREAFAAHPLASASDWRATAVALWRGADRREQRYAAIALAGLPRYRVFETRAMLPVYEEWVVTGAWWDYVDQIAAHRLGALLRQDRAWMSARMRRWAQDPHLWKRRAAILCQLTGKRDTDLVLLHDCIAPNLDGRDFFIRKAIGWALRQHARTDPAEVARYVAAQGERLSPLSRREALKHLGSVPGGRRAR